MSGISIVSKSVNDFSHTVIKIDKLRASKSFHVRTELIESPTKDGPNRTEHRSSSTA